jgi:predicted anti-sigma-YlaC factor YlaD
VLCTSQGEERFVGKEMMELTCAEVLRELSNYIDDDVTAELRARINSHVSACGGCRALYDSVRNVIVLVGAGETIPLPEGFSRRLRQKLARALAN